MSTRVVSPVPPAASAGRHASPPYPRLAPDHSAPAHHRLPQRRPTTRKIPALNRSAVIYSCQAMVQCVPSATAFASVHGKHSVIDFIFILESVKNNFVEQINDTT